MKELNFQLRADEIADLDPYGVRRGPVLDVAQEILEEKEVARENPVNPEFATFPDSVIYVNESDDWNPALGIRPDIRNIPLAVTKEIRKNLADYGLKLIYMPQLDLQKSTLQNVTPQEYIARLYATYPNWKPLDYLTVGEKKDAFISRNIDVNFWKSVKENAIDFPVLPGQWMAVETAKYPQDDIPLMLKLQLKRQKSWEDINKNLADNRYKLLTDIGFAPAVINPKGGTPIELRLLEALEWNLLANRFGWQKEIDHEFTNTKVKGSAEQRVVAIGEPDSIFGGGEYRGGAGAVSFPIDIFSSQTLGWRAAVVFPAK